MKSSIRGAIILLAGVLSLSSINRIAAAQTGISLAMVLHDEIYVSYNGGELAPLTADRTAKAYPLWSQNGKKIAFVETNSDITSTKVVVIDHNGRTLASFPVHPGSSTTRNVGMRDVEGLEWLADQNIVVTGSINPSTTEYDVFDAITGRQLDQFFDDGRGMAFSPNGRQYAHIAGGPHFTPADEQANNLKIGHSTIFPLDQRKVTFLSAPQWSADSHSLSVFAAEYNGNAHYVVLWRENNGVSLVNIPFAADVVQAMFWSGSNLYLSIMSDPPPSPPEIWQVFGGKTLIRAAAAPEAARLAASAEALSEQMQELVAAAGGSQANFWCKDCALAALPRKTSRTD
jgi:hypothetical protein